MWDLIVSVPDHCLPFYFKSGQWMPDYYKPVQWMPDSTISQDNGCLTLL